MFIVVVLFFQRNRPEWIVFAHRYKVLKAVVNGKAAS